jgi:hypothetical protein
LSAPLVSVVLPVYNGERWLREAVASVLTQTLEGFEVVAVNDGSTDASGRILAELTASDPRVRSIESPSNRGLIETLNRGFGEARGRYVARLDADDVALPERLERQVAAFERDPGLGLVASAYWRLDASGKRTLRRAPAEDTAIRWRMLLGNPWCHSSMMIRRSLLEAEPGPYGSAYRHAEDFELWVRLLRRSRGATLREPLVVYREHATSVSNRHAREQQEMVDRIAAEQIRRLLPGEELSPATIASLRRVRSGKLTSVEDVQAAAVMSDIFEAFGRQEGIDWKRARELERKWIARVLGGASGAALLRPSSLRLVQSLARQAPGAAIRGLVVRRGKRLLRRAARAVRA